MSEPDPWYAHAGWSGPMSPPAVRRLNRRVRTLIIVAEATIAGVGGGVIVAGRLGTIIVALTVVAAAGAAGFASSSWRRRSRSGDPAAFVAGLRVLGVESRSSGEIGVISDRQGYAAGIEVEIGKGIVLDLATRCSVVATDASRPSALQARLTSYAPPVGGGTLAGRRVASAAVYLRLHVLVRLEPVWAGDVVDRHGGGAAGSRAALVAAVDRLSARLRRAGVVNRVIDSSALSALLAEDADAELPTRLFAADPSSQPDVERLLGAVRASGAERSIVSFVTDLTSGDQWQSCAVVQLAARDVAQVDRAAAVLRAEPGLHDVGAAAAVGSVLPLGGGPGELTAVLTLARV